MTPPTRDRATTQSLATLTVVVATLVVVGVTWVFVGGVGGQVAEPAATATVGVETANLDDGVARNDVVMLVHEQGDAIDRGVLRVTVDGEVTFVRDLSEGGRGGLVTDVDGDGRIDLFAPDGGAVGVTNGWDAPVTSGDRLVIRERDHALSADVVERGETVRVVCVTENGGEVVLVEAVV